MGFEDSLWQERAAESAAGCGATTFVVQGANEAAPWLGLVTVLGPGHAANANSPSSELLSMWIAPEARRQGLALRLLDVAVQFAMDTGAPSLALAVTRGNAVARLLYEDYGFVAATDAGYPTDHACHGELRLVLTLGGSRAPARE
ncbi:MAG: GNAT family N-acetyltransferase [Myxococcales bacterium]|nr:GNAT family N-acetyltransferase [Myxococcales bacterium]